jgi:Mg-chelatase subunit ChlD
LNRSWLNSIGLITFHTTVELIKAINRPSEDFLHEMNRVRPKGQTALWNALALANDQLSACGKQFPDARKRIISISDGKNTIPGSNRQSWDLAMDLYVSFQTQATLSNNVPTDVI